jgi:hypothetical protein
MTGALRTRRFTQSMVIADSSLDDLSQTLRKPHYVDAEVRACLVSREGRNNLGLPCLLLRPRYSSHRSRSVRFRTLIIARNLNFNPNNVGACR